MSLRETLEKHSAVTIAVVVIVLLASSTLLYKNVFRGRVVPNIDQRYFFDLNTGMLFLADVAALPPVEAPSGTLPDGKPAGVRAHVYACGECGQYDGMTAEQMHASGALIGWVETYSQAATAAVSQNSDDPYNADVGISGQFVRDPLGDEWIPLDSDAAAELMRRAMESCPAGQRPNPCHPGR